MNEMDIINQQMQMWAYWNTDYFAYIWVASIIIQLIVHLLTAWWLWNINKKLWEPHAWISWIPVINIYSFVRAAWYPNIWILWLILWSIAIVIPFIWIIIFLFLLIKVLHWISKRCWRWAWTTIWFLFISFIMFPIVWNTCNSEKETLNEEDKNKVEL